MIDRRTLTIRIDGFTEALAALPQGIKVIVNGCEVTKDNRGYIVIWKGRTEFIYDTAVDVAEDLCGNVVGTRHNYTCTL